MLAAARKFIRKSKKPPLKKSFRREHEEKVMTSKMRGREDMKKKEKIKITREHLTERTERFCFAFTIKSRKRRRQRQKQNTKR